MTIRRWPLLAAASTVGLVATLAHAGATPPPPPPGQKPPPPGAAPPPTAPPAPTPTPTPPGGTAPPPVGQTFPDPTGESGSVSTEPPPAANSPFFTALGTNGRACVTCHRPDSAWSFTPQDAQADFANSEGTSPLFRVIDGSDSPVMAVSTEAEREKAYSMLLTYGDIRVGLPMPNNAQFTLSEVQDPYNFANASQLSLFRRPLPATNLRFLSTVMWDGREMVGATINADLDHQATDAVLTHEQGTAPSTTEVSQMVEFETSQYSAQTADNEAGSLDSLGASGGPLALSLQSFSLGENAPGGASFNPNVFNLYSSWAGTTGTTPAVQRRQSIARGEQIFNTRPISITNVAGLNDVLKKPVVMATCSTCHNSNNVGNNSAPAFFNTGVAAAQMRTPDFPLYTFKNSSTGATVQVSDPGLALTTGEWADIGKFKVPTLRGLPARAPYFHNGTAPSIAAVVGFYDNRFQMNLSPQESTDLQAFLESL